MWAESTSAESAQASELWAIPNHVAGFQKVDDSECQIAMYRILHYYRTSGSPAPAKKLFLSTPMWAHPDFPHSLHILPANHAKRVAPTGPQIGYIRVRSYQTNSCFLLMGCYGWCRGWLLGSFFHFFFSAAAMSTSGKKELISCEIESSDVVPWNFSVTHWSMWKKIPGCEMNGVHSNLSNPNLTSIDRSRRAAWNGQTQMSSGSRNMAFQIRQDSKPWRRIGENPPMIRQRP